MNTKKRKLLLMFDGKKSVILPPVNLLEFDVTNTTISAGAMTNVTGGDWLVARNSVASYSPTINTLAWVGIDIARIEGGKVLIESTASNLLLRSNQFDLWQLGSGVNVTSTTINSPEGLLNAFEATTISLTSNSLASLGITTTELTTYVFSWWAKRGTLSDINYSIYDYTNKVVIVNPTSYFSETSSEWVRIEKIITTDSGTLGIYAYVLRTQLEINNFNFYQAQFELGTKATSNINTGTSVGIRQADVITITVPVGATQSETWIDGVSQGIVGITVGDTFTMVNGTTKIIMN